MAQGRQFTIVFRSSEGTLIAVDTVGKAWERTKVGEGPSYKASETKGQWKRAWKWDAPWA